MATYPKLLNLDEDTKTRLISYINQELLNCYAERQQWVTDLTNWQIDYWIKPSTERRTFPFTGASNLIVPLIPIAVEATHARTMTTLRAVQPEVSVIMRVGGQSPLAQLAAADKPIENFMDYQLNHVIELFDKIEGFESSLLELEKFGTGVTKQGYEKVIRKAVRYIGEERFEFDVVTKDSPTVDSVPISRYIQPYVEQDPQKAPWCGEEHSITPYQLLQMQQSGMFYPDTYEFMTPYFTAVNSAAGEEAASGQQFTYNQQQLEKKEPVLPRRVDFVELWMGFDIDQDGRDEELQVLFHRLSQKLMAVRYNENEDLRRPYRHGVYIPVEHRFYGLGICKQTEQFQREVTTIHRQRLDNATLANMRMFKINKLSGYGPKEPIFPGKMWFLDDMDQVDTVQMGEIYPSAYSNEQSVLYYAQQRNGANDAILGMPQTGTPGTATGDLARIQEGNKKFDYVLMNVKRWLSNIIGDTFLNIKQYGTKNAAYFDLVEGGHLVRDVLSLPVDVLKDGIIFEIGSATSSKNKLADRQTWQQLAAMLQQYFMGMVQFAQATGNPMLFQLIVTKGMTAITEAMSQILDSFDVRNKDRILVTEIANMMQMAGLGNGGVNGSTNGDPNRVKQLLVNGGNGGSSNSGAAGGMDILSQMFGAIKGTS